MVLEFLVVGITAISSVFQSEVVFSSNADFSEEESFHSALANEAMISDCASVTVFMHGLGGSAYDWISGPQDDEFPRLDNEKNGAKDDNGSYVFKNHGYLPFDLSNSIYIVNKDSIIEKATLDEYGYYQYVGSDPFQINLNEHLVVLFDQGYSSGYVSTLDKYHDFEKAIDSLLYKYYETTSIIPKINLVGHSLGGTINTMYAIEHPALVSNLISIGTPHLGSRWAESLDAFQKVGNANHVSNTKDIIDPSFYLDVLQKWLKVKEENPISAVAIACTQSYEFFAESIDRAIAEQDPILAKMCSVFSPLRDVIDIFKINEVFNVFVNEFLSTTVQTLKDTAKATEFAARIMTIFVGDDSYSKRLADALASFVQILACDFQDDTVMGSVLADCCVEAESQKGAKFVNGQMRDFGFDTVSIHFTSGAYNYERAEFNEPGFLHNFEPKAPEVVSRVRAILKRTSENFHVHNFGLAKDDSSHWALCDCGAKVHARNHSLLAINTTNDFEYYRCGCGYETARKHAKKYRSFDTNEHVFYCSNCGFVGTESHSLYYLDSTKSKHMAQCDCGYSAEETHAWFKRRCTKCNRSSQSQWEIKP